MLYLLFFLSGISGLIYQVVWVRVFGNVFGNTIYSASIVVAVFMLGLGVGSYVVGAWADRQYSSRPESLLRAYGYVEGAIAALGFAIAMLLPHLGALSSALSSYVREPSGWYALSAASYAARAAIAVVLLAPITLLMGGTLTLLIRHLVRSDVDAGGWRIARLYGVNTVGAALGALLTDFMLVPRAGLWGTQMLAVAFNIVAGLGALYLAAVTVRLKPDTTTEKRRKDVRRKDVRSVRLQPDRDDRLQPDPEQESARPVILTSLALAMAGFAALGMEILWFRHFTILLGGFRAVFSLLLTLILLGIGAGSLVGGALYRRTGRPVEWLMLAQGAFVAAALLGLASADVTAINTAPVGLPVGGQAPVLAGADAAVGALTELWFNARPMLLEVVLPALLMGFSFPLGNAIVQRAERSVGRRAGVLYLANTIGAVGGSVTAGFVLLPMFGLQHSATILMTIAGLVIVPLYFAGSGQRAAGSAPAAGRGEGEMLPAAGRRLPAAGAALTALAALMLWLLLPSDFLLMRTLGPPAAGERRLVVSDGLTELIAVTEREGQGRTLHTNGHAMSSTLPNAQRYMRALAHVPLLSMENPESVLVIGFGVGNTTHAATLHPSVRRIELADLSRDILAHAGHFADANRGALAHGKVAVHINDGRQHLQMQPPATYDLVVLEPPPIAYAGVSALYSREFYALARSRLKTDAYISQWLPAYQVPTGTALAMVRAFVDVFPQSVLLSGAAADLMLVGTTAARVEIDPVRLDSKLSMAPAVRDDLARVSLGRPHEIVGTFVGSARTLADATRGVDPVLDDRPLQEYGVRSMLSFGHGVPADVVDLPAVGDWCPRCFASGRPIQAIADLDAYLRLMELAYSASRADIATASRLAADEGRTILGSEYLGATVPEHAETHIVLGLTQAERGDYAAAIGEFRRALALEPDHTAAHWHLGAALASSGELADARQHLQRAVELDPSHAEARNDLAVVDRLLQARPPTSRR